MALEFKDRVADTTSTTGTGAVTLAGSPPAGYRAFTAHTTGATVRYCIASGDSSEWEVGEGVWTASGATLTRVTVYASSNAGAPVDFSAGTKTVTEVMVAESAAKITHLVDKLRVRNATGGTSAAGGYAKIPFDTVDFDTASLWDGTNNRYTPNKPGYYHVNVTARTTTAGSCAAGVKVSGGTFQQTGAGAGNSSSLNFGGSTLVYCNGTTDYIEAWAFTGTALTWATDVGLQSMSVYGPL